MDTFEGVIYSLNDINLGIWGLMEIKLAPDNPNIILSFKSRVMEVAQPIFQVCLRYIHH